MSEEPQFHEALASAMNDNNVSIEELAHEFGVSSTLIQKKWLIGEMLPVAHSREKILAWVNKGGMRRVRIRD